MFDGKILPVQRWGCRVAPVTTKSGPAGLLGTGTRIERGRRPRPAPTAAAMNVVVELLTESRFLSLSRREADLAFRIRPFDEPDVVSRRLLQMHYGAYVAESAPEPRAGDGEGIGLITMDTGLGDMPDVDWLQHMLPNARVVFRSNARSVQARMCRGGAGVAVLPLPLAEAIGGLRRVELGEEAPRRETWIGYHRDMRRLARLRALLELVAARLAA